MTHITPSTLNKILKENQGDWKPGTYILRIDTDRMAGPYVNIAEALKANLAHGPDGKPTVEGAEQMYDMAPLHFDGSIWRVQWNPAEAAEYDTLDGAKNFSRKARDLLAKTLSAKQMYDLIIRFLDNDVKNYNGSTDRLNHD